jgi:hypothetical protein
MKAQTELFWGFLIPVLFLCGFQSTLVSPAMGAGARKPK